MDKWSVTFEVDLSDLLPDGLDPQEKNALAHQAIFDDIFFRLTQLNREDKFKILLEEAELPKVLFNAIVRENDRLKKLYAAISENVVIKKT